MLRHNSLQLHMQGQTALHLFAGVQNTAISHSYYKFLCTDTIKKLLHAGANIDAADHQVLFPNTCSHEKHACAFETVNSLVP